MLPAWAVGLIVEIGSKLISWGVDSLRNKVDETPNKIDDRLVKVVDIVVAHKVKQKNTTVDALLQKEIKRAISKIND